MGVKDYSGIECEVCGGESEPGVVFCPSCRISIRCAIMSSCKHESEGEERTV